MLKIKPHIISIIVFFLLGGKVHSQAIDVFKDFRQLIPRGSIPAVVNPTYLMAGEADISDETWILGIVLNGQARAYSLNLLNDHEIVNDVIDTTAFAADPAIHAANG
jgi:hypothetical protein